jgi:6-phosphogluconolactonase (cycloisomerase 2 family)
VKVTGVAASILLVALTACGTEEGAARIFAYTVDAQRSSTDAGTVSFHRVDPETGGLTALGRFPLTRPGALAAAADGRFLYATVGDPGPTGRAGQYVQAYAIATTSGELTPAGRSQLRGGVIRVGEEITLLPGFLYLRTGGGTTGTHGGIDGFRLDDARGGLEPLGIVSRIRDPTFIAAGAPGRVYAGGELNADDGVLRILDTYDVVEGTLAPRDTQILDGSSRNGRVDPAGRLLAVAIRGRDGPGLATFRLDPTTGRPQLAGTSPLPGLDDLVWHEGGRFLHVSVATPLEIRTFTADAVTGALRETARAAATTRCTQLAADPGGRLLHCVGPNGDVDAYRVDDVTGALSPCGRAASGVERLVLVRTRP